MGDNKEIEISENLIEENKQDNEIIINPGLQEENNNINKKEEEEEQNNNLEVINNSNNNKDSIEQNVDLNKSYGQIIEEDIKRSDTTEAMNLKKKNTKEGDEEAKNDENITSKKIFTKFKFHRKINQKFLRYSTLVIIILYILITLASCIIFHRRRKDHPYLFCFKFIERDPSVSQDLKEKDIIYFLTDLNSFYILHTILLGIFISIIILLIRGKNSEIEDFFSNVSIFLICTLVLNIPILFNGMFTEYFYGSQLQSSIYLGLTLLSLLCMGSIYLVTKSHKYKNMTSFVNISVLSSLMTAYQCYCFLFTVSYFIMNFYKPQVEKDEEYPGIEYACSSIYFATGLAIIFLYQDIFFIATMVNMQIGLLYTKRESDYSLTTSIVNIAILSLTYGSIIVVIFKSNKKVFMQKEKKKK